MTAGWQIAVRAYLRFAALLAAMAGGLLVVGVALTRRWGGASTAPVWAACAVSLLASLAGGLPLLAAGRRPPGEATGLLLGSLLVRLAVVVIAALLVVAALPIDRREFLVWLAVSYLVLLAADVGYAVAAGRRSRSESHGR